ncbi:uncharacterized protein N7483_000205, partial [Penicillium malachiteum]|uniref:uncharacterized protein n=1 Tax=Penicillium malachiteum TaxID=1324776 RepID=UPI0025467509
MREKIARPIETSPLLKVHAAPQQNQYSYYILYLLLAVVTLFTISSVLLPQIPSIWSYMSWQYSLPPASWPESSGITYDQLQKILLDTPNSDKVREWSSYYTSGPHLAGKNYSQALWTLSLWKEFGVEDTTLKTYDVYLNYPVGHRLALIDDSSSAVIFEATLKEDVLEEDPTTGLPKHVPAFHAYSASGNVNARFVYVNFGTYEDFKDLDRAGILLEGTIAIAKYGRIACGLKIKAAQEFGIVGVVIYNDPQDDGEVTEDNGYKAYPHGPARNPSAIQRHNARFLNVLPGDPTTPECVSKPGCERQETRDSMPTIPSLPVSYKEILPFLKALNGRGPRAETFGDSWKGGLGYKDVEYNIGPSPENLVINLVNEQNYQVTPIWNVIGVIEGHTDEVVILGNHRDAWGAGGAGDPNSGSAVLNEVVRSFGEALKFGWKPLRTIVFGSWDGGEYGLLGSTEWVKDNFPWISETNIAYLNVDMAVTGTVFEARASPLLEKAIRETIAVIQDQEKIICDWGSKIEGPSCLKDLLAFQHFAGVPSMDFGFRRASTDPVHHSHSSYDSLAWMEKFGDHDWTYHLLCAKLWALVAARLIDSPLIPFSARDHALHLYSAFNRIKEQYPPGDPYLHFALLHQAMDAYFGEAREFDYFTVGLAERLREVPIPWYKWWTKVLEFNTVRRANERYKALERAFLYLPGLDGRNWFKHVAFAPDRWTGNSTTLPGLLESLEDGDYDNIKVFLSFSIRRSHAHLIFHLLEMGLDYSKKAE